MDLTALSRVLVAHNPVGEGADASTSDVLAQVELVKAGLDALGLPSQTVEVPDWKPWLHLPAVGPGTAVFNLMEAPAGRPEALLGAASGLEMLGVPFTGSAPGVLWVTTDKLATRAVLAAEGVPVPPGGRLDPERPGDLFDRTPGPWILKPACEDASLGLEGDPVCRTSEAAVARARALAERFPGQAVVAETFLPGRELNVSLLARDGDVEVLPVAEIVYEGFPDGMSRVLNYEAKWDEESFACIHTVRHFPEGATDGPLLARAAELSRAAWRVFGLRGYARVDLRLDAAGEPHVLEVNANPCLAADGGFMAAAGRAGLTARDVVERILRDAVIPAAAPVSPPKRERPRERHGVAIRRGLEAAERAPIEELIRATSFFNAEEVEVALELVDDRLSQGEASHYRFLVGEVDGEVAGYACWGPIPGTAQSADLYWIVVHPRVQSRGVGAALLQSAEEWMKAEGRPRVYVETSTRPQYLPTRAFYAACNYQLVSELKDFYAPGDGKATFLKVL